MRVTAGLTIGIVVFVLVYLLIKEHDRVKGLRDEISRLQNSILGERKDAVARSRAVNTGLIAQDMAPLTAGWPYGLKDSRQVGHPLDYIVFDGMSEGDIRKIIFVEIKTGSSRMSSRQHQIASAVRRGDVEYHVWQPAVESEA
jgi:predicted Holliday junction resolvase-like endonuclease